MKNHLKGAMIANDMKNDQGGYTTSTNIRIQGGVWDASKVGDKTGSESFRFIHANNATITKNIISKWAAKQEININSSTGSKASSNTIK